MGRFQHGSLRRLFTELEQALMMQAGLAAKLLIQLAVTGVAMAGHAGPAQASGWPYLCFFEQGSVELSDRCKAIIGEAVHSWRLRQEGREFVSDDLDEGLAPAYVARFEVWGYAQDAGGPVDDDRLSVRRALAVAQELKRLGVPDGFITPIGFGDADPLVPGDPMDPQNRRVQVAIR